MQNSSRVQFSSEKVIDEKFTIYGIALFMLQLITTLASLQLMFSNGIVIFHESLLTYEFEAHTSDDQSLRSGSIESHSSNQTLS